MKIWLTDQREEDPKSYLLPASSTANSNFLRLRRFPVPSEMGSGVMKEVALRPGFNLFLMDYELSSPFTMHSDSWPSGFSFTFFISGKISYRHTSFDHRVDLATGQNRMAFQPDHQGFGMLFPGEPIKVVTVSMSRSSFLEMLGGDLTDVPESFRNAAYERRPKGVYAINSNTANMQMALHRLARVTPSSMADKIMVEGLALDLIAGQLKAFGPDGIKQKSITQKEKDQIAEAREILLADMTDPPQLIGLARTVGLSANRLSEGFKALYGSTPFAYLKDMRLERARLLLLDTGLNVSEVAFAVGYNSLSHFSRSFSHKFGIQPGRFKSDH